MGSMSTQSSEVNASNNFTNSRDMSTPMKVDALPTATTNITNDAEVVHGSMNKRVFMDNGLSSNATISSRQTIESFLEKPFPFVQGLLQTSDNSSSFTPFDPITQVLSNAIFKNKIDGHLGFRATTIVRLQVNAERFQQGRYILAFIPFDTVTYVNADPSYRRSHTVNLTTVTQLPHVELDLNCDTEAVLEIPYVSPASHYSILDQQYSIGHVFLYPYVPLSTGSSGSTSCEYTIWVSYKDVQLAGPTIHQSNFEFQARTSKATGKRGNASEIERDSVGTGPISSTLYKVSQAADVLSQIPLISAFTGPVSWATDIFARAATVFGWSNPIDLSPVHRMVQTIFPYSNNCDVVDESMPISLFSKNLVEPYSGFAGTDIDEMSIDYIKTIPAFIKSFNFTTSSVQGTVLQSFSLHPALQYTTGNDGVNPYFVKTPVSAVAQLFQYYRGSLKFTFKIAKTEFHSGRVLLAYVPQNVSSSTPPSFSDTTYLHREVIDLRMGNEFSFVIPYASLRPYRYTQNGNEAYGYIHLYVLNELVAPATVSGSVTFVVEVSAASDMEFAVPRAHSLQPYAPAVIQSNFQFQMDSSMSNVCSIIDSNVGSSEIVDDGLSSARLCIGEKIMSLLSLIKKKDYWRFFSPTTNSDAYLIPFALSSQISTLTSDSGDTLSYIASWYGLSRGGVRIRIPYDLAASNTPDLISSYRLQLSTTSGSISPNGNGQPFGSGSSTDHALGVIQRSGFRSGIEIQVPQYSPFPFRVNSSISCYPTYNSSLVTSDLNYIYYTVPTEVFGSSYVASNGFYRQAADDFQLGYFVSTTPELTLN